MFKCIPGKWSPCCIELSFRCNVCFKMLFEISFQPACLSAVRTGMRSEPGMDGLVFEKIGFESKRLLADFAGERFLVRMDDSVLLKPWKVNICQNRNGIMAHPSTKRRFCCKHRTDELTSNFSESNHDPCS